MKKSKKVSVVIRESESSPNTGSSVGQPEALEGSESGSSAETGSSGSSPAAVAQSCEDGKCGKVDCRDCQDRGIAVVAYAAVNCIVIPYRKEPAAGHELLFALRAWEKNYPGCKVVIIGDREDWFSDELLHIHTDPFSKNPQVDVANKLIVAISAEEIPDDFIWSNDDIYPVTQLHPADLELLTCNGRLQSKLSKPGVNGTYADNKQRTIAALKAAGLDTFDYSTHTPFVFNKSKLAQVIEKFRADHEGYLVSSLYFNSHYPGVVPLQIDGGVAGKFVCYVNSAKPPKAILEDALKNRKFVNINSHSYKAVLPYLKAMFPGKSRFEK